MEDDPQPDRPGGHYRRPAHRCSRTGGVIKARLPPGAGRAPGNPGTNAKGYILAKWSRTSGNAPASRTLKIGYNRVFGYYIEVSKGASAQVPEEYGYVRKQTLTNAERYITSELKEKRRRDPACGGALHSFGNRAVCQSAGTDPQLSAEAAEAGLDAGEYGRLLRPVLDQRG